MLRIKILHDEVLSNGRKHTLAVNIPKHRREIGGINLVRTNGNETTGFMNTRPVLCFTCGKPMTQPGWKTMFHETCYHEQCLDIVTTDPRLIRKTKQFNEYKKLDGALDMKRYAARDMELSAVNFFSPGGCLDCNECIYGNYTTDLDVLNAGWFSHYRCELCHDTASGQRYPAHARTKDDNTLIHYDICLDCLQELS